MSSNQRDVDRIAERRRTSCCKTGLLNLGSSALVSASNSAGNTGTEERDGGVSLPDREPHKFLPSQQQAMALWSMAYGCEAPPLQLRTTGDMFPTSGTESSFQNEFYVMDVILNRSPVPPNTNGETDKQGKQKKQGLCGVGTKARRMKSMLVILTT